MNPMQFVYWALVGWCGTPWPRKWPLPPNPDPEPWWRGPFIGIVGGIIGGYAFGAALGMDNMVVSSFGALAGGRVLNDLAGGLMKR